MHLPDLRAAETRHSLRGPKNQPQPKQGPIRFVGGPWHNRFVKVEWLLFIRVPIPIDPKKLCSYDFLPSREDYQVADYELRRLVTNYNTLFFEYHLIGSRDA